MNMTSSNGRPSNTDASESIARSAAVAVGNPVSPHLLERALPTFVAAGVGFTRSPIMWFATTMLLCLVAVHGYKIYSRAILESLLHDLKSAQECNANTTFGGYTNPITMRSVLETHVSSLEIKHDENWGTFLPRLGALTELSSLILDTGHLSVERARLIVRHAKNLSGLHLWNCSIEPGAVRELRRLPRLKNLGLAQVNVTQETLDDIAELTNLDALSLTNITFDKDLWRFASFEKLPQLRIISLYGAALDSEDMKAMNSIPKLTRLWLQSCTVSARDLFNAIQQNLFNAIQQNHQLYVNVYARDWSIPDAEYLRSTLRVSVEPDGVQGPLMPPMIGNSGTAIQQPAPPLPPPPPTPVTPQPQPVQTAPAATSTGSAPTP